MPWPVQRGQALAGSRGWPLGYPTRSPIRTRQLLILGLQGPLARWSAVQAFVQVGPLNNAAMMRACATTMN